MMFQNIFVLPLQVWPVHQNVWLGIPIENCMTSSSYNVSSHSDRKVLSLKVTPIYLVKNQLL